MSELKLIWKILIFFGLLVLIAIPPTLLVFGVLSKATAGFLLFAVAAAIILYIGLPFLFLEAGCIPKKSISKKQMKPRKVLNTLETSEMDTLEWASLPSEK